MKCSTKVYDRKVPVSFSHYYDKLKQHLISVAHLVGLFHLQVNPSATKTLIVTRL